MDDCVKNSGLLLRGSFYKHALRADALVRILLITALWFSYAPDGLAQSIKQSSNEEVDVEILVGEYTKEHLVLGVNFKLKNGWKMYWKNPGNAGFPPEITWAKSKNISGTKLLWPFPKRDVISVPGLSLESYLYQNEVLFPIYITPKNASENIDLDIDINFGVCKQTCIPVNASFKQSVQAGYTDNTSYEKIKNADKYVPKENGTNGLSINDFFVKKSNGKQFLHVLAEAKNNTFKDHDLFIDGGSNYGFYSPKVTLSDNDKKAEFVYEITFLTGDDDFDNIDLEFVLVNRGQAVMLNKKFHKNTGSFLESS